MTWLQWSDMLNAGGPIWAALTKLQADGEPPPSSIHIYCNTAAILTERYGGVTAHYIAPDGELRIGVPRGIFDDIAGLFVGAT